MARFPVELAMHKQWDCWEWTGQRDGDGYGLLPHGPVWYAHRLLYEMQNGCIPAGLVIDHLCRNRACCNPNHLEPVTAHENWRRGNCPSAINARKNHCMRGHKFDAANTLWSKEGKRQCRECKRVRTRQKRLDK